MQKLEIVSLVKIDGKWVNQNELCPETFREVVEKKMDQAMGVIGFQRTNTA